MLLPKRPLRSLMIGDTDHYFSPYIFGVGQACSRMGILHSQISIRWGVDAIERRILDSQPDIIWTHMALWPPRKHCERWDLADIYQRAVSRGVQVILHDGDPKEQCRSPYDLSGFFTIALCNHRYDRSVWQIPTVFWPYAAFVQDRLAEPNPALACDVAFAGRVVYPKSGSPNAYKDRTAVVIELEERESIDVRVFNSADQVNTMFLTPELAVSALSVLGFGRKDSGGWVDTRVFQYPGAGAILIHDDVGGLLEPYEHYIPYESGDVDSIVEVVDRLRTKSEEQIHRMRTRAFKHGQKYHSWVARVGQVLGELYQ